MVDLPLTNMTVDDQRLNAEIASVQNNNANPGPKYDFEMAAEKLIPLDPVDAKTSSKGKRKQEDISVDVSALTTDSSKENGKKQLELKFYPPGQHGRLPRWKKSKLREWQATAAGKKLFVAQKAAYDAEKKKAEPAPSADAKNRALIKSIFSEMKEAEKEQQAKEAEDRAVLSSALAEAAGTNKSAGKSVNFDTAASIVASKLNAVRATVKEKSK